MANLSQTTDEDIFALTSRLDENLKVQETCSSASHHRHTSSAALGNGFVLPLASSVIGSNQLSLLQLTLTVQEAQPVANHVAQEHLNGNSNPHVILHVDGTSASAASPCYGSDQSEPLEVVQLELISDKFPVESIPRHLLSKGVMFLVKFWADFNFDRGSSEQSGLFRVITVFESTKMRNISCKTSVCSFGHSVGDKVETLSGVQVAPNRVIYQNTHEPLCDYLTNFIYKLKGCDQLKTMNGVLENFSICQIISDDTTQEILLCFVYIFEVCQPELSATTGSMCKVFQLEDSDIPNIIVDVNASI